MVAHPRSRDFALPTPRVLRNPSWLHGRYLLDTLISRKGYEVVLAENGRKGLELFRREHPDAVVLDLKMPEMDGITVLKHIRSCDQQLPVIVLTGAGTPETEQQAYALGVTEFVEKEFSLHRLGDSLKRHLYIGRTAT